MIEAVVLVAEALKCWGAALAGWSLFFLFCLEGGGEWLKYVRHGERGLRHRRPPPPAPLAHPLECLTHEAQVCVCVGGGCRGLKCWWRKRPSAGWWDCKV